MSKEKFHNDRWCELTGEHEKKPHTVCVVKYDSFAEMVEECGGRLPREGINSEDWTYGDSFPNFESTRDALNEGRISPMLAEEIEKLRQKMEYEATDKFKGVGKSNKRKRIYRDEGDEISIDRVMSGDPYHWEQLRREAKNVSIHLGINIGLSCGNKEREFAKTAALMIVAADMLTRRGFAVEIKALSTVYGMERDHNESGHLITLKRADEEFDMQRIAACGLPGLLRHFCFVAEDLHYRDISWCRGSCWETSEPMKQLCEVDYLVETKWVNKPQEFIEKILTERGKQS